MKSQIEVTFKETEILCTVLADKLEKCNRIITGLSSVAANRMTTEETRQWSLAQRRTAEAERNAVGALYDKALKAMATAA